MCMKGVVKIISAGLMIAVAMPALAATKTALPWVCPRYIWHYGNEGWHDEHDGRFPGR